MSTSELSEKDWELIGEHNRKLLEQREKNIKEMIHDFRYEKRVPQDEDNDLRIARDDAARAKARISQAQRKIRDLQIQIEQQEKEIREADKIIRKFKRLSKIESVFTGRGRPRISNDKKRISKYFVSQWVTSLMDALNVKSCRKLESLLDPHTSILKMEKLSGKFESETIVTKATERNWRRWLNGEAIPNYSTFEILMTTKIDFGSFKGQLLQDIPTTPSSADLQTLLSNI